MFLESRSKHLSDPSNLYFTVLSMDFANCTATSKCSTDHGKTGRVADRMLLYAFYSGDFMASMEKEQDTTVLECGTAGND